MSSAVSPSRFRDSKLVGPQSSNTVDCGVRTMWQA
jgi:hypothetical protein